MNSINSLADRRKTVRSSAQLDFVLNINSYSGDGLDGGINPISTMPDVFCLPCDDDDGDDNDNHDDISSGRSSSFAQMQKLSLAVDRIAFDSPHIIPQTLRTHGLKVKGVFDLKRLERFLDNILYSGGGSGSTHNGPPSLLPLMPPTSTSTSSSTSTSTTSEEGQDKKDKEQPRQELYRLKGVVHIYGKRRLHIIQAVHDVFEITESSFESGGPGDITEGMNLIVIIGKMVQIGDIERGMNECTVVSPTPGIEG